MPNIFTQSIQIRKISLEVFTPFAFRMKESKKFEKTAHKHQSIEGNLKFEPTRAIRELSMKEKFFLMDNKHKNISFFITINFFADF